MYLKTYAKFTFCIKSQGHVSDENFLYYCTNLASKISSYGFCKYIRQKDSLLFTVKVFNFFRYVPQNIHGHFSHTFKVVTPRALRQLLLFIALICLTSAAFIANLWSCLIPVHYKTSTTCTSKRTHVLEFNDI